MVATVGKLDGVGGSRWLAAIEHSNAFLGLQITSVSEFTVHYATEVDKVN